jgi:hypothetical protein
LSEEGQRSSVESGLRKEATIPRSSGKTASQNLNVREEKLNLFPINPALADKYDYYNKLWRSIFYNK